jgi:SAM-dependent methyltransferase
MREASKTLGLLTERERAALSGKGLDIGAGSDPIRPDVQRFDVEHGDANRVTDWIPDVEMFDYVFSSHCLEHVDDPVGALADWWRLVRPGGILVVVVPDEDLYEQGYWPSLFNSDHKSTFAISKNGSWSPVSRNLMDLGLSLDGAVDVAVRLQDRGYRHEYLAPRLWPYSLAKTAARIRRRIVLSAPPLHGVIDTLYVALGLPVDQTLGNAVAQSILVAFKAPSA